MFSHFVYLGGGNDFLDFAPSPLLPPPRTRAFYVRHQPSMRMGLLFGAPFPSNDQ